MNKSEDNIESKIESIFHDFRSDNQYNLHKAANLDEHKTQFRQIIESNKSATTVKKFIKFSDDLQSALETEGENSGKENLPTQYLLALKDFSQGNTENVKGNKFFDLLCGNPNIVDFLDKNLIRFGAVSLDISWATIQTIDHKIKPPSTNTHPKRSRSGSFHENLGNVPPELVEQLEKNSREKGQN
ncbi:MAG: hypothetical protein ACJA02_000380 [Myxococcota bacterium]|jgi:hypothetical protein